MRRVSTLLLAALMMVCCAYAEVCAPTETPMPPEQLKAAVDALFGAVTGTDVQAERAAREGLEEEEIILRNEERALYRAGTLAFLKEALRPAPEPAATNEGMAEAGISPSPSPAPTDTPAPSPTPSPIPSGAPSPSPAEIILTAQDGYEALGRNERGREYLSLLSAMGAEDMESCMALTREILAQWMAQIDHARMLELNEEYVCWIFAPDTQIDYPIVQGEDNSYYLKRMFNGEKNSAGTLFIDYRNLPGFQDPNTLVYGHHMRNNSMFGTLTDYADQAYFEAHPYMIVMSAQEIAILELFAGYMTSDQDHCYDIAISDEEDMRRFLEEALRKSDFVSGVQVQPYDRLVTLSTCAYAFEDARYIVLGRLNTVWRREMTADAAKDG